MRIMKRSLSICATLLTCVLGASAAQGVRSEMLVSTDGSPGI